MPHAVHRPAHPTTDAAARRPGRPGPRRRRRALAVLVASLAAAAAACVGALAALPLVLGAGAPTARPEDLLAGAAGVGAALLGGAWSLAGALAALAALAPHGSAPGRALAHASRALAPTLVRVALVAALGAGPVAGAAAATAAPVAAGAALAPAAAPAPPTAAETDALPPTSPADVSPPAAPPTGAPPTALAVPDVAWRPAAPVRPRPPADEAATALVLPAPREGAEEAREVVVVRGDTLWDIARRALPAGADDGEVADAWPAWYAANRHVVGPDPDLLRPGQRLVVPDAAGRP